MQYLSDTHLPRLSLRLFELPVLVGSGKVKFKTGKDATADIQALEVKLSKD